MKILRPFYDLIDKPVNMWTSYAFSVFGSHFEVHSQTTQSCYSCQEKVSSFHILILYQQQKTSMFGTSCSGSRWLSRTLKAQACFLIWLLPLFMFSKSKRVGRSIGRNVLDDGWMIWKTDFTQESQSIFHRPFITCPLGMKNHVLTVIYKV